MTLPDDTAARLALFEGFASSEVLVPLEGGGGGEGGGTIEPRTFETSDGVLALGFADEESLADFTGGGDYAALPGRVLAALLSDQGIGLCLNPGGDAVLLGPGDLRWLTEVLAQRLTPADLRVGRIGPVAMPEGLRPLLEKRLAAAFGLVEALVLASHDSGAGAVPLIALIGVEDGTEAALGASVQEALAFSAADGAWQIAFLGAGSRRARELLAAGEVLVPVEPAQPEVRVMAPPGSDPEKPPILR